MRDDDHPGMPCSVCTIYLRGTTLMAALSLFLAYATSDSTSSLPGGLVLVSLFVGPV